MCVCLSVFVINLLIHHDFFLLDLLQVVTESQESELSKGKDTANRL